MRIGVFSDSLPKLPRRDMFAWCAERGISDVELGVGAWGPWPRPHLDLATIGQAAERHIYCQGFGTPGEGGADRPRRQNA